MSRFFQISLMGLVLAVGLPAGFAGVPPAMAERRDASPSVRGAPLPEPRPSAKPTPPAEGPASDAVKDANNPLAPVLGFNLQNYFAPTLNEVPDATSNAFLLRAVTPFWRILPRLTLPVMSVNSPGGSVSGLGDMQVFVTFLVTDPTAKLQFGIGPQYTAPTATDAALGTGKHAIGGASVLVWSHEKLLLGTLVQLQGSVAGDDTRPDATTLAAQVFAILQIGGGYYLRSTPLLQARLDDGTYSIPFGIGAGKVVVLDRTVFNWFLEPQMTFLAEGAGQPMFQLFSGLNIQYKL